MWRSWRWFTMARAMNARAMRRRLKRRGEASWRASLTRTKVVPQTKTTASSRMCARVEGLSRCGNLVLRSCFGRLGLCGCGVDGVAVDDGAEDFGVEELLGRGGGDVAVEDNEVGEVTGFEAALHFFSEFAEGGGLGVGVDRFVERDLFLRLEGLSAGFVLAGDGGVEAAEGIDEFDGVVGAES